MSCTAGTYSVSTSSVHTPTWSGSLVVNPDGTATFTPTGGTGGSVNVQCGVQQQIPWISFTNTNVTPAIHYKKALQEANSNPPAFKGEVSDSSQAYQSPAAIVDTWVATSDGTSRP